MEIMGRTSGKLGEYLQAKRERELASMREQLLRQKGALLRAGFPALCNANLEEFHAVLDGTRRAVEECDVSALTNRSLPGVIMIPDGLVSIGRKLEMLAVTGVCRHEAHKQPSRLLEPYIAVNVMCEDMRNSGVKLAHCYAERGAGLVRLALTLGEVLMVARYYPAYFEDRLTAVVEPEFPENGVVTLAASRHNEKFTFSVTEYLPDDLPDAPFQVLTCEVRVGR